MDEQIAAWMEDPKFIAWLREEYECSGGDGNFDVWVGDLSPEFFEVYYRIYQKYEVPNATK